MIHLLRGRIAEADAILSRLRTHPALTGDAAQIPVLSSLLAVYRQRYSNDSDAVRRQSLEILSPSHSNGSSATTRHLGPGSTTTLQAVTRWAEIATNRGRFAEGAKACRSVLELGTAEAAR
jgi:hypothetical protein